MSTLAHLTDESLHRELKRLVGNSNTLTAQLLAQLGEVEARGIHRERACSSLYTYCVYELRMSEDEAQRRCRAARLARQFPVLLDMLAEASLHLTGILLLGPHLTEGNQVELLARARFRTKREIERLVAEIAPCPDVPSRIVPLHRAGAADAVVVPLEEEGPGPLARPRNSWAVYVRGLAGLVRSMQSGLAAGQVPPRASGDLAVDATIQHAASGVVNDLEPRARSVGERIDTVPTVAATATRDNRVDGSEVAAGTTAVIDPRADDLPAGMYTAASDGRCGASTPVAAGDSRQTAAMPPPALRYKVQFTADQAYVDLLEEARNLLQHELPARDLLEVQRRALELLVGKLRQRKHAYSKRLGRKAPQPAHAGSPSEAMSKADRHAASPSEEKSKLGSHDALPPGPESTPGCHDALPPEEKSKLGSHDALLPKARSQPGLHDALPAEPESTPAPPETPQPQPRFTCPWPPAPESLPGVRHGTLATPPGRATPKSATPPPRATPKSAQRGRYIPAEVRRRVWQRDDARCTYLDGRGQRCRERAGLEFHHQHPHARGGSATVENLTLRCRSHNALAAEHDFGHDVTREKRAAQPIRPSAPARYPTSGAGASERR